MSDERIESALRQGPPDEPAYIAHLTPADLNGRAVKTRHSSSVVGLLVGFAQTAVAAILIVAVAGVVVLRSGVLEPAATPPTMLADAQARGVIRIAVRPDLPQVAVPGGAKSGFDVDVATEMGRRLGLRVELVFTPVDAMLAGRGDRDIALPSTAIEPGHFAATAPYYHWPVQLIVPGGSAATAPGNLTGSTICVVSGSTGEAWMDGSFLGTSSTDVVTPPKPVTVRRLATDQACAADVDAGSSAALVTAGWSDADLATRPSLKPVGGPVLTEARPVIAIHGERDPTSLIAEIDQILRAMRDDGTLADFSRSRFGGLDLTQPPTP